VVKTLLALWSAGKVFIAEAAGATAIVYGVAQLSHEAAWITGGVAVVLKSFEWDLGRRDGDQ
jgi:hypothetical protein